MIATSNNVLLPVPSPSDVLVNENEWLVVSIVVAVQCSVLPPTLAVYAYVRLGSKLVSVNAVSVPVIVLVNRTTVSRFNVTSREVMPLPSLNCRYTSLQLASATVKENVESLGWVGVRLQLTMNNTDKSVSGKIYICASFMRAVL